MRVIFLTHNYPRHPGDLPGGFLHPLALALRSAGVDITVVAPSDLGRAGRAALDGIPVRRVRYAPAAWEWLGYSGRLAAASSDPRGALALAGLLRALRRGARVEAASGTGRAVIHAHWWFPAGLAAPPELPLVVTLHGTDGHLLAGGGLGRMFGRRVLRRAAVVTTVSQALARTVATATGVVVPPSAIQGLPLEASRLRPTTGGGGVVAVARLTAQKRLHLLVEAVAELARQGREVPLTIAGDGPEAGRLEALIAKLGLARQARLTGPLTPEAVATLLAGADCFVLPAVAEGYGMAAAEALASGVPLVVCTDGGGLVELAGAGAGSRIVAPDPGALAGAISALLDDPAARPAAVAAGHQLRLSLSPEAAASKAIAWYQQALAGHG